MAVEIDHPVPHFRAQATSSRVVSPETFAGKQVVLYFYPKDTRCTTEGQGFATITVAFPAADTRFSGYRATA